MNVVRNGKHKPEWGHRSVFPASRKQRQEGIAVNLRPVSASSELQDYLKLHGKIQSLSKIFKRSN